MAKESITDGAAHQKTLHGLEGIGAGVHFFGVMLQRIMVRIHPLFGGESAVESSHSCALLADFPG
jgi:hypothetical protein